jgi:hypothetical protein
MGFRVVPATVPASTEEWQRARYAPFSELPQLTQEQLSEVRQFSLDEEEYRRFRVLLRKYVLERQHRQGAEFGNLIQKIIEPLGESYSLASVSRRGTPLGWRVTIRHEQKGIFEFQCPLEDVDAVTAGRVSQDEIEILRGAILLELGEATMIEATS